MIGIDAQIAWLTEFCQEVERGEYPIDSDASVKFKAILATLQSIKDAGDDVVEPSTAGFIRARAEKAEAEREQFRKDAEKTKSDTIAVIRKLLEALNHPNPPTSSQWEAIRVEARKQIAAIDSARNK